VLVTDHHLPGDALPDAACIVNPNQPGCTFASKNLAGVGVMFYVLLAVRAELRQRGRTQLEPDLRTLLDLVALGTVADVVRLDANNRTLVENGLARMRAGKASAGINALFRAAGRDPARATVFDLGFMLGPRLNAAGRIDDMALGIECLLADDPATAQQLAQQLDAQPRGATSNRHAGGGARHPRQLQPRRQPQPHCYQPGWHIGVIGILASRLKDKFHRPTIVLASQNHNRGSGAPSPARTCGRARSGRQAPSRPSSSLAATPRRPDSPSAGRHDEFSQAFEAVVRELIDLPTCRAD
jgi:single-stranded-DNA-specific exonuclease